MRNLEAANQEALRASTDLYFGDTDPAVGDLVHDVAALMARNEREKKEREAKQRMEAQRQRILREMEAKQREIEAQKWAMVLDKRRSILTTFPDGNVPLSSHKVDVPVLYFFSYTLDPGTIEQANPVVTVANTFPVHRRGDGTWPFKNSINADIRKIVPGENTLMGYYATQEMADSARSSFLKLAKETGFQINNVNYERKAPQSASASNNAPAVDFWSDDPAAKKAQQNVQHDPLDFWK